MKVLVTGATGKQGGATARALLAKGHEVRAVTRNPDSPAARNLADAGAEIAVGDFRDRDTLTAAMQGVDTVFAMSTFFEEGVEGEVEQGKALIDTARAAGVAHLVQTSVASADRQTGIPHFDSKGQIERYLADSGVPCTVIAPCPSWRTCTVPR